MRQKWSFILVAALLLLIPSCKQHPHSGFKVLRLIDALEEKHIILSPLRSLSDQNRPADQNFPVKSFPLQDMGSGENPLGLKRKIKVWREYVNALHAPPESQLDVDVHVEEESVLEFGIGVISDENSAELLRAAEGTDHSIRFSVLAASKGREEVLFEEILDVPTMEEGQVFVQKSVDLSPGMGIFRLSFRTSGREGAFSFWSNPVLFPKEKNHRQVILISIDTLRADHLGVYGYRRETSPNIDALAAESARFVNVYAPSPWTLSSHVSLLTSLNCVHHQVYQEDQRMDPELVTVAELMRVNDFFCSAFTGGGFVSSVFGFADGFDTYYERTDEVLLDKAAELCFRDVARWIDHNKNKDFFLFIHTYQPHDPYACPHPYKSMFLSEDAEWSHINLTGYLGGKNAIFRELSDEQRRNIIDLYDAEIRYTDDSLIGPLIQKLKELSLFDQAMIIFTSDHGEEFYDHQAWGHGHSLYDESLKVPLLIKFPDRKFKGVSVENIVSLVDVVPTILEGMGLDGSGREFDGRSLVPILTGREKRHRTFLADVGDNVLNLHLPQKMAANEGQIKLILNKNLSQKNLNFFLFLPPPVKAVELYDLSTDPSEKNNIVDEESQVASHILDRIEETYKRAVRQKPGKAVLDEELKKQLKALGYIK